MTKNQKLVPSLLAAFLLAILIPFHAWAHAILVSSTPRENSIVPGSKLSIALLFNSRIDQSRSKLSLESPSSTEKPVPVEKNSQDPAKLSAQLAELPPGAYKLHWQVLSIDGHITRGQISFRVK